MSILFAENVANSPLEDSENDEDIFAQFNVDLPTKSPSEPFVNASPSPSPVVDNIAKLRGPLRRRAKHSSDERAAESDSQAPYGVRIYDLLENVKKRKNPDEGTSSAEPRSQKKKLRVQNGELLCEKYRPRQFFDLIGNDDANRLVLRWLTRWRSVVFGTEPELSDYTDSYGRPLRKVLLINGPPGSGKTSAAHSIAKQAGYDVLEINASDERNAAVVNDRITTAVQSHQAYSKRPICIIADEVEGASEHGFVRGLINLLKEDQKALSTAEKHQSPKRKRKARLLKRPIIAVCNDVWASNLHALRQHAEIVHFQRHSPGRLLKRLEAICRDESIPLSARTLAGVADSCDYDMRACLNAIQFGAKFCFDQDRENFELTDWSALAKMQFQAQKPATFQQLESCSDLDKLVSSCFTAYPTCNFIDDMMNKPAALGEFLDLADHRATTDEIKAMVVHSFGYFFRSPRLSASKEKVPLLGGRVFAKPPSHYETVKQTKSLVDQVLKLSGPSVRKSTSSIIALTELLPYAVQLACLETMNSAKGDDKHRLVAIAGALKDMGIGLKTEKLENGAVVHKLEPPIENVVNFDEEARELASAWKLMPRSQLQSGFIELHNRETAPPVDAHQSNGNRSVAEHQSVPENSKPPTIASSATSSSKNAQVRKYGFFGQEIMMSSTQVEKTADQKARKVWVQYSEGFSNAVRKSISWNELFEL